MQGALVNGGAPAELELQLLTQPMELLRAWCLIWLQHGFHLLKSGLRSTGGLSALCCTDGLQRRNCMRDNLHPIGRLDLLSVIINAPFLRNSSEGFMSATH